MAATKLQTAGATIGALNIPSAMGAPKTASEKSGALLYGGVALGVLAGAAISTYLWRQRVRALNLLNASPLQRAEELISSCENKLADIERAFETMQENRAEPSK